MALTQIANLWTPDIWLRALNENLSKLPSVINSGVAINRPDMVELATGAGIAGTIPLWADVTDDDEAIQIENTAPTRKNITATTQIVPILNRVLSYEATALSGQVSTGNPVEAIDQITRQLGMSRLKRRQKTLIALLRGVFGTLDQTADEAEGCLRANRYDVFDESGNDATSTHLFDADKFNAATALLGENADELIGGAMLVHPIVYANLKSLDKENFKEGVESGLPFRVNTYQGIPIFRSSLLKRAGGTNGSVYETYVLRRGIVGMGDKPQIAGGQDAIDVAALQFDTSIPENNQAVYDRTRGCMHVNGTKWTGTPAGQSATDAELATAGNWTLLLQSADRLPGVVIRTNG
jgi:hypothetical protein